MITFLFDHSIKMPMYEQLYKFIRAEIESGRLKPNEKLPSKRKLATHLKISTITVQSAYEQLEAEGYLKIIPKSGHFVQPFESSLLHASYEISTDSPSPDKKEPLYEYDFKTNVVDTELFPFATWAKLTREVLAERSGELLNSTHPQGTYELRKEIADHLYHYRGVKASPEQIVVGAGSEYLMGLLIQLLEQKSIYAIENPGYHKIYKIFQCNRAATVPISLDTQGFSIENLRQTRANIIHITPSHQFPSGIIMPVGRRKSLMNWANEKSGRYIIEDDYDSEFRFSGHPIPALQGMDYSGKVIYINAFTKSLAPSLRISYMVLPPRLLKIYQNKFMFYSCSVSNFEQYILCKFMAGGHFERHLFRMRGAYKERRDFFLDAISCSGLNGNVEIIGDDAGLHLLMKIHNGMDESELIRNASAEGVRVYGLSEYYSFPVANRPESTVVIGYSGFDSIHIHSAVKRLEKAWIHPC